MCPVNVRTPGSDGAGGNHVVAMAVPLHTDVADPADRLASICESTRQSKEITRAVSAADMLEMANFIPSQLSALGARVAAEQGLANFTSPTANTVITNVPGSPVPFYSNGAIFVRGWGLGPCVDGNGLFHSVGSHCGELTIGVTCCRAMMPDPAFYTKCLNNSFTELKKAFNVASVKPAHDKATESEKKVSAKKVARKKKRVRRTESGHAAESLGKPASE
jgi:hypothetical protein